MLVPCRLSRAGLRCLRCHDYHDICVGARFVPPMRSASGAIVSLIALSFRALPTACRDFPGGPVVPVGSLVPDWSEPSHSGGHSAPICYWYVSNESRWHGWPASYAAHGGAAGLPARSHTSEQNIAECARMCDTHQHACTLQLSQPSAVAE